MKHTSKVIFILLSIFLLSQVFGLFALNKDIKVIKNVETGKVETVNYSEPAIGARPEISSSGAFWYIIFAVFIGTMILLLLIRFRQVKVWKAWFFLAVWLTMTVTLGIFMPAIIAYIISLGVAILKIFKPNFFIQNISEILMYTGIALLFVPLLNIFWVIILLLIISLYDAYAVWHSKHMVKMANFQTESKLFAGLTVPYKPSQSGGKTEIKISIPKGSNFKTEEKGEGKIALLGGGDIAFPLIFSGVVMQGLVLNYGLDKFTALLNAFIITFFSGIALMLLFIYGKKDKFYPAMPFISAGCILGYGAILLIHLI